MKDVCQVFNLPYAILNDAKYRWLKYHHNSKNQVIFSAVCLYKVIRDTHTPVLLIELLRLYRSWGHHISFSLIYAQLPLLPTITPLDIRYYLPRFLSEIEHDSELQTRYQSKYEGIPLAYSQWFKHLSTLSQKYLQSNPIMRIGYLGAAIYAASVKLALHYHAKNPLKQAILNRIIQTEPNLIRDHYLRYFKPRYHLGSE
jgi:hypothetical protein